MKHLLLIVIGFDRLSKGNLNIKGKKDTSFQVLAVLRISLVGIVLIHVQDECFHP